MRRLALPVLLVAMLAGCATGGGRYEEGIPREDRYFLIGPSEGYSSVLPATTRQRLDEAHAQLLDDGNSRGAAEVANEYLGRDPDLAPARVLRAQGMFVDGQYETVVTELLAVVKAVPTYTAAQLLFGRASEKLGELVDAYEAYHAVELKSPLARSRSLELEPRAIDVLANRIEDALAKGDPTAAQRSLEQLSRWAPANARLFELSADVARSLDDSAAELQALRQLTRLEPDNEAVLERRAQLEMKVGDPATGLRLLEEAAANDPQNTELAEALMRARFLWRLQLLPPDVRQLAQSSSLDRGEFATLLYWLFPDIRYGRGGDAIIANDILEHPNREQIVKVANSGIMDVDASLHRFDPDRPVSLGEALSAMLRILARQSPPIACLGGVAAPRSSGGTCHAALACGLIADEVDCVLSLSVDGTEAMDLCRLTQELLGN